MPIETISKKRQRMARIVSLLKQEYPDAHCSLEYKSSFQLLVSTILSAKTVPKLHENFLSESSDKAYAR